MQTAQILNDLERQVQAEFPDLANPQHPLTLAYEAELKQLCATAPDHVLQDPQMEIKLAARIAQRFETEFQMPVKRASKPAATAPVAKTNTTAGRGSASCGRTAQQRRRARCQHVGQREPCHGHRPAKSPGCV
jgi:hypothetical protein